MRARLPSSSTIDRVESLLLRWIAPGVGIFLMTILGLALDSRNPFAWAAATTLVTLRVAVKLRDGDDSPPSIDPPPTRGSSGSAP
ncbi:hypothetical protein SK069_05725 [Patulibacter brassicae]|uniref:DUF202 domain-containing protein n=1 Tax=Patulibacter brassicae TaxID=1705717 RepID=A0ABU4VJK0_9ACTN|nr:hypothetical protein [Patulibacter brassicae]MDX8151083.1 hypothetical protein [Patulibacter brassicae]